MIGIYKIENKVTGSCYYGSSKNIEKRWRVHMSQLNRNVHINYLMQKDWILYGKDNFEFKVVEECIQEDLLEIEQKYLDLDSYYNIGKTSSGGDNLTKNPNRDSIIDKIKHSVIERMNNLSTEEKKKYFSKPLSENPNWKGGVSYIHCVCGKRIGYGHKHCSKCTPKSGENNPFFGKKHSEETKEKLRKNGKNRTPANAIHIIIEGIEYKSFKEASNSIGLHVTTIRWRCLSSNPKYKDYYCKGNKKETLSLEDQYKRHSAHSIGKKTSNNKAFYIEEVEYRTLKEASDALGIPATTIKSRLISGNEKFNNYKYKLEW
jgi:group I intron endonuclease